MRHSKLISQTFLQGDGQDCVLGLDAHDELSGMRAADGRGSANRPRDEAVRAVGTTPGGVSTHSHGTSARSCGTPALRGERPHEWRRTEFEREPLTETPHTRQPVAAACWHTRSHCGGV